MNDPGPPESLSPHLGRMRLLIFDFGGVIRDTSRGLDAGYRAGFESEGLQYPYHFKDTWHLRGIGKYDIALECIKALLALTFSNQAHLLHEMISQPDAEDRLDAVVKGALRSEDIVTAERIRKNYKAFFNSGPAGTLVTIHTFSEKALASLVAKGYLIALLTNGNRVTVDRDLPFGGLFHLIISEDDVPQKKPSSEGLRMIMHILNVSGSETAFICDASVDIKAAKNAGCVSVALLSGMGLKMHLSRENPDLILDDLKEFEKVMPILEG
jgi:HAD superfamily hydrolase (TIGR01509 family)